MLSKVKPIIQSTPKKAAIDKGRAPGRLRRRQIYQVRKATSRAEISADYMFGL
jgi:ribosomal protein S30